MASCSHERLLEQTTALMKVDTRTVFRAAYGAQPNASVKSDPLAEEAMKRLKKWQEEGAAIPVQVVAFCQARLKRTCNGHG